MKKTYISPVCLEIEFDLEDIITLSGTGEEVSWNEGVEISIN